jgi:hypothetical protein
VTSGRRLAVADLDDQNDRFLALFFSFRPKQLAPLLAECHAFDGVGESFTSFTGR